MKKPLVLTGKLKEGILSGKVAIVTGAGQGIGYETARSLAWLGANVIIAEINKKKGKIAAQRINNELCEKLAYFIKTDVGNGYSINRLKRQIIKRYKRIDIILNNAAITHFDSVQNTIIKQWDKSYKVNLRGPVLLAQKFLPLMLENNSGVFVCVYSEGLSYMGPYETMKSAQNHLASTIDAELEGMGVVSFSIAPGFVLTETAQKDIKKLAELYGKTDEELYSMYKEHIITAEEAGASFAAAVSLAGNFRGQEIGSKQALILAGIDIDKNDECLILCDEDIEQVLMLCIEVKNTLLLTYQAIVLHSFQHAF